MLTRRAFAAGVAASAGAVPMHAGAFVETTISGVPHTPSDSARSTLETVATIAATQFLVRIVWRPPSLFPPIAPVAYYVGRGDARYPGEYMIWLNPDHPELVSPRTSRLTDEVPLFTELLLASIDVRVHGAPDLGLERLPAEKRRAAAAALATNAAVVARYSPYVAVDDGEFARRRFAFAVLRQLTPQIGGVAPVVVPASRMPADEPYVVYVGRDTDPGIPKGWAVIHMTSPAVGESASGYEAWVRAFVLATADLQPPASDVKRAYDAATAQDAAVGPNERSSRRAFALPYVKQVSALFGR